MKKISVCMATRNGEKYLREQLASILCQLGLEDEVIISDDSSTDRTVEIIREFKDPRILLLENNTFYSPIFNFENALRHASGDIILLSDQDDVWLDNKVAVVRELFTNPPAPVWLVVLDAEVIDENGNVMAESVQQKIGARPGVIKNWYDNTFLGCCLAFSKELLPIALPFPRRIPMHDMWLGLLAEIFGKVSFVPVKTMRYRKHSASMTEFRIRFIPWTQIKRRWFLGWSLWRRWKSVKQDDREA